MYSQYYALVCMLRHSIHIRRDLPHIDKQVAVIVATMPTLSMGAMDQLDVVVPSLRPAESVGLRMIQIVPLYLARNFT